MKMNLANIKKAKKLLYKRECIAIPTETVYGLAGNAYSDQACQKIYKLKKRPKNNPLIVHYLNIQRLKKDCHLNNDFIKLYKKFCPGPLTFVLKKNKKTRIDSLATAKLNTVAIRFPKHKVVRKLLKLIDFPLAMPSANRSSYLSPINANDVYKEFKNKLNIIINGGKSKVGIESTVVDLTEKPRILRPGIISYNEIKKFLKIELSEKKTKIRSPGMLKKHYSPGIPVVIGEKPRRKDHAYIFFGKKHFKKSNYFNLSKKSNLREAASNLYKTMRKIKDQGYKKIFVAKIPNLGPGIAINDRLTRASK